MQKLVPFMLLSFVITIPFSAWQKTTLAGSLLVFVILTLIALGVYRLASDVLSSDKRSG